MRQTVALYGLEVPCGDILIPAVPDFPATVSFGMRLLLKGLLDLRKVLANKSLQFRITMAAIDPSEPADAEATADGARPRATLKIVRQPQGSEDDEDSEEYMRALLAESDSEEDEEEETANGGPSDPAKSKKARKAAAVAQLIESLGGAGSDDEMEDAPTNGKVAKKGKAKASKDEEESEEDSDDDDDEEIEVEEFVLCTLDPEKVKIKFSQDKIISNFFAELPATTRHHHCGERACLLQGIRNPHYLPHR